MRLAWAVLSLVIVLASASATAQRGDRQPPFVEIVEPAPGAVLSGEIEVVVLARDEGAVAQVALYLDEAHLETATRPVERDGEQPEDYRFRVDISSLAAGDHLLRAEAQDGAGNVENATVSFRIAAAPGDAAGPTNETSWSGWLSGAALAAAGLGARRRPRT